MRRLLADLLLLVSWHVDKGALLDSWREVLQQWNADLRTKEFLRNAMRKLRRMKGG